MYPPGVRISPPRRISSRRWTWSGDARTDGADAPPLGADEETWILVADATVSGGSLALDDALSSLPGATMVPKHHTVSPGGERVLHLFVADATDEDCRDAFTLDPTVVVADHVATFPDGAMYRLTLSGGSVLVAPTSLELGARALSVRGTGGAWKVRLQFPDREALVALRQFCAEHDVQFGVDSLYRTDWTEGTTTDLTARQREALLTAFERGYYDVPRDATQEDLAAALDISKSAVSHRLRRATAQLVEESFDGVGDATRE